MPIRRTMSAPAESFPAMLLKNADRVRYNAMKNAWKNKARNAKLKNRVKNVKSKLPKTRNTRRSLLEATRRNKLQNRIRYATNQKELLEVLNRAYVLQKRHRAHENAERAQQAAKAIHMRNQERAFANVGIYRGLRGVGFRARK